MNAILLVPSDTHHIALLKCGPCGDRPPVASEVPRSAATLPCPVCGSTLRWSRAPTEQSDSHWVCAADWRHEFRQADVLLYEWKAGHVRGLDYSRRSLALVLAWEGVVLEEGCDRAMRVLLPLRLAERERYEEAARKVYESWPESARHPWTPGGNSETQYEARCAAGLCPSFGPVMDYHYSPEWAGDIAAAAERLGVGTAIVPGRVLAPS